MVIFQNHYVVFSCGIKSPYFHHRLFSHISPSYTKFCNIFGLCLVNTFPIYDELINFTLKSARRFYVTNKTVKKYRLYQISFKKEISFKVEELNGN